jgi:hypothetical protein
LLVARHIERALANVGGLLKRTHLEQRTLGVTNVHLQRVGQRGVDAAVHLGQRFAVNGNTAVDLIQSLHARNRRLAQNLAQLAIAVVVHDSGRIFFRDERLAVSASNKRGGHFR